MEEVEWRRRCRDIPPSFAHLVMCNCNPPLNQLDSPPRKKWQSAPFDRRGFFYYDIAYDALLRQTT